MTRCDNADVKWSENKIKEEDRLRTVTCLRGRLLAERLASRNAREEAEQLGNKLLELENLLKEEAKSRNRAEKKLKSLMRRLESMNLSFESEQSGLLDKTETSSVSSRASSTTKEAAKTENLQMNLSTMCGNQQSDDIVQSWTRSENLRENDSQLSLWSRSHDSSANEGSSTSSFEVNWPELNGQECEMGSNENRISLTVEDSLSSAGEPHFEKPSQLNSNQMYNNSKTDVHRDFADCRMESTPEEGLDQEDDQDPDNHVDDSTALVPVDMPQKSQSMDPEVLDATVKQVLELLRRAKEQLQSSMERKRIGMSMIKVG